MNAILTYLLDNAPMLALVLIIGFIAWKAARFFMRNDNKVSMIEKSMSELQKSFDSLRADVMDIQLFITSKFPTALNTFAAKHSPLKLNEYGERLFAECGGKNFLEANQVLLLDMIDKKKPQTALDVEISAKEVLLTMTSNSIFNPIKVWIYNSPAWKINDKDYTISLGDVCFVLSIPLRDKYLELHKEIAQ